MARPKRKIIRWETPPPAQHTGSYTRLPRPGVWSEVADDLRMTGEWAVILEGSGAASLPNQILRGMVPDFPEGEFEVTTRMVRGVRTAYARYIGD